MLNVIQAGSTPSHGNQASILGEMVSGLAAGDDLPDLLKRFLGPLLRLAGADAGAVRAISDDGGQLVLVSSVGLSGSALRGGWTAHRDCGACGSAATANAPAWAVGQANCLQLGMAGHASGDFRRMLAVPLKHRGRVLGVYSLFFRRDDGPAPEVLSVLESVGDLLGLALNNARLEGAHLRAAVIDERRSMAAELHDSIAQTLGFARLRLTLLDDAIAANDQSMAQRCCADVRSAVSEAHTGLRELLSNLHAPVDPLGLRHAVQSSIDAFEVSTGIEPEFRDLAPGLEWSGLQEVQLSRIVQEALNNIAKHAGARHAWLTIARCDGGVEIVVEDDGHGVTPGVIGASSSHYGIDIMRQRAAKLGGTVDIGQRVGGGTRVRAWVPLPSEGKASP